MTRDYLAEQVGWLDDIFTSAENSTLFSDKKHLLIQSGLFSRWKNENRLLLIEELSKKYGEGPVLFVIDKIIYTNSITNWEKEGKEGTNSLNNFINILWKPLKDIGFVFTYETKENVTQINVTKCPMFDLANQLDANKWFYHLICLTDEPSIIGFNKRIEFKRTKTLMQGNSYCDHCYIDHSI
jgi:predicted ArsR family transcriptional regulator